MPIKTICFMKNNCFSEQRHFSEKVALLLHLQISLVSGLTENSWMLISASGFNLFQYAFSLTFLKEMLPHSVIAGKREHILIGSEDNCGTFFLILKQHLTIGSVLQVNRSKTWNCFNGFFVVFLKNFLLFFGLFVVLLH